MLTADRTQLQMWASGVLLDFSCGRGVAVNETACQQAIAAMDRGEAVALLDGAELTGAYMILRHGEYVEVASADEASISGEGSEA